jgi:hypothetical protein
MPGESNLDRRRRLHRNRQKRYSKTARGLATKARFNSTPKGKALISKWNKSSGGKATRRKYDLTDHGKAVGLALHKTEPYMATNRRYHKLAYRGLPMSMKLQQKWIRNGWLTQSELDSLS